MELHFNKNPGKALFRGHLVTDAWRHGSLLALCAHDRMRLPALVKCNLNFVTLSCFSEHKVILSFCNKALPNAKKKRERKWLAKLSQIPAGGWEMADGGWRVLEDGRAVVWGAPQERSRVQKRKNEKRRSSALVCTAQTMVG